MNKKHKILAIVLTAIVATAMCLVCGCTPLVERVPLGSVLLSKAKSEGGLYVLAKNGKTATLVSPNVTKLDSGYQSSVTAGKSSWIGDNEGASYSLWTSNAPADEAAVYEVDLTRGDKLIYICPEGDDKLPVYHEVGQCAYWQGADSPCDVRKITSINGAEFSDYALFNANRMKAVGEAVSADGICYAFFSKDNPDDVIATSEGKFIVSCASPASVYIGLNGEDESEVAIADRFAFALEKLGQLDFSEDDGYYVISLDDFERPYLLLETGEDGQAYLINVTQ